MAEPKEPRFKDSGRERRSRAQAIGTELYYAMREGGQVELEQKAKILLAGMTAEGIQEMSAEWRQDVKAALMGVFFRDDRFK